MPFPVAAGLALRSVVHSSGSSEQEGRQRPTFGGLEHGLYVSSEQWRSSLSPSSTGSGGWCEMTSARFTLPLQARSGRVGAGSDGEGMLARSPAASLILTPIGLAPWAITGRPLRPKSPRTAPPVSRPAPAAPCRRRRCLHRCRRYLGRVVIRAREAADHLRRSQRMPERFP